jgi:hypothetical protein
MAVVIRPYHKLALLLRLFRLDERYGDVSPTDKRNEQVGYAARKEAGLRD